MPRKAALIPMRTSVAVTPGADALRPTGRVAAGGAAGGSTGIGFPRPV